MTFGAIASCFRRLNLNWDEEVYVLVPSDDGKQTVHKVACALSYGNSTTPATNTVLLLNNNCVETVREAVSIERAINPNVPARVAWMTSYGQISQFSEFSEIQGISYNPLEKEVYLHLI